MCTFRYTCDTCGFEIYQEVNAKAYTPLFVCPSQQCQTNRSDGKVKQPINTYKQHLNDI